MPEGDTLHKVAAFMHPLMVETTLVRAEAARLALPQLIGRRVRAVQAVGKHLLIDVAVDGAEGADAAVSWQLRVHLGMHGSWHVYPKSAPWRRPAWTASVVLLTDREQFFVCFSAQDVELSAPQVEGPQSTVGRLGPDLLAPECDTDVVVRRARLLMDQALLLDTLLDQRVAAGLGNVYKSELLFLFGRHPSTRTFSLSDTQLQKLYQTARRLMQQNLGGWSRTTTSDRRFDASTDRLLGPRLYVYRRHGDPCLRCRTPIAWARLGRQRRGTYWCPRCQPTPLPAVGTAAVPGQIQVPGSSALPDRAEGPASAQEPESAGTRRLSRKRPPDEKPR